MKPRSWIRNLFARRPGHLPRVAAWRRATARLHLESLEDRVVPAAPLLSHYDGLNYADDGFLNGGILHHPPDPNAAVGTTHTVAVVNTSIEIRQKGGGNIGVRANLGEFFGGGGPYLFDPKVLWDRFSQRFFVVTMESNRTSTSVIRLAVSPTGDPSNYLTWQKYSFNAVENIGGQNCWADYPGFGVDSDAVYITANMFTLPVMAGQQAVDERLWIVNKANLISGTLTQTRYAPQDRSFTMQPAQMYQDLPTGAGTFLVSWLWNQLRLIRVASPLTNPTFTTTNLGTGTIDSGFFNPGAPQQGSSGLIDAGDKRILSAIWSHGELYATNTINPNGRDTAHWYRIDTTDVNNPRLADQGNIDGAGVISNMYTYYPAVTVNDAGDMAVGFSGSNATDTYAGAFYTTRLAGDPAGYTEPIAFLRGGDDWYSDNGGGNRWGDYTGAGLDPDGQTFYLYNEYAWTHIAGDNGRWATQHGTSAYATHYRLVTAGGVTTLTLDNSVTSVGLTRSGSSTQISVNGANIGSTTSATINVQAGWALRTGLTVTNAAAGTYTLTASQFVSPGLTVNVSNLGDFVADSATAGSYTSTYTVVNTPAGPGHTTTVKTGGGNATVNVQATSGALTIDGLYAANNDVALGNANSLAGITGAVTINGNSAIYQVEVNDGADNTNHPNVLLTASGFAASLTGLAPAAINFQFTIGLSALSITVGNGNNTYTVSNTPNTGHVTALNTGTGTDTVNVQATSGPLTVNTQGGGGNDVVNLGNNNSLSGLSGAVTLNGPVASHVNVNDGADVISYPNVLLSATSLTGLAPAAISFGMGSINTLSVAVGNGTDTYTITGTPGNTGNTLSTGNGADTVNVQATSNPLTVNFGNSQQVVNLGNAGTLAGITAAVSLNNVPNGFIVNVNDGADNADHPAVVIAATGVTGLAPAPLNFDMVHTGTLNITVGNGADAYRITETPRNALNLNTGTGTNTVTLTPTGNRGPITLTGNPAGANILVGPNGTTTWHITGANAGNLSAGTLVSFTGYASLTGGSGTNVFSLSNGASLSGTLTGGSSNTLDLSASTANLTVNITGTDAGNVAGVVSFRSIQNVIGSSASNGFSFFTGALLHGLLSGGSSSGNNGLDLSPLTANLTVNITGTDAGNVAGVVGSFAQIANVLGGSGSNRFVFSDGARLDGILYGGVLGSETLDTSAYSTAESFTVTGPNAGSGTPVATFYQIQNLIGAGVGGSYFQFADGARLDGNLAGGGRATLDYSPYTTSVVVDLQPSVARATGVGGTISGITSVIGASGAPGTAGLYNLLIGSDVGGDTLQGGTGRRNLLVAGGGASTLIGGDGEDLLIGGTTAYDTDPALANWLAIANYWAGTDDFATRSANLQSGNGVPLLDATTVTGNGGGNTMRGNGGTALIYTDGQDSIDNVFGSTSLVTIAP